VLAHPPCNRSKSDSLAGRDHLQRWLERIDRHGDAVAQIGSEAGIVVDAATCRRVASWSYGHARTAGGQAWLSARRYEAIGDAHLALFA
jgi:hypothetical protein